MAAPDTPKPAEKPAAPSLSEWLVAGLGLSLVVACLAFLIQDALGARGATPAPTLKVLAVQPQGGRFLVQVQAFNDGRQTAASLRVTGELRRGDEVVERSQTEFQYLPSRSTREAGLYFARDPRQFELQLSAESFQQP